MAFKARYLLGVYDAMLVRWSRRYANKQLGRLKAFFGWAVLRGHVDPTERLLMSDVRGARLGEKPQARETEEKMPAPLEHVLAVMEDVTPTLRAMIQTQLTCGARPGELFVMQPFKIEKAAPDLWRYYPGKHKNAWREGKHERFLALGPEAIEVLAPLLEGRPDDAYVFSPRESEEQSRARRSAARESKVQPSQQRRAQEKREAGLKVRAGTQFDRFAYRNAIRRACARLEIPVWTPYQLRHTAATECMTLLGAEATMRLLGQKSLDMAYHYSHIAGAQAEAVRRRLDEAKAAAKAKVAAAAANKAG